MTDEAVFVVRVQPRSSRDAIDNWDQGVLRVRLRAPPVEGRANEALRRLLAERLDVPPRDVVILAGETSRTKRVRVEGLTMEAVRKKMDGQT